MSRYTAQPQEGSRPQPSQSQPGLGPKPFSGSQGQPQVLDLSREGSQISSSDQEREAVDLLSVVDHPASEGDFGDSGSEDEPLYGTYIPSEVFDRALS